MDPIGQAETDNTANLTKREKVIAVCLLLFYLGMIGVTISTAPFANVASPRMLGNGNDRL